MPWRLDEANSGQLEIIWVESGGPIVAAPERRGFGTRLLERGLPAQLNGDVVLDFRPEGLRCAIVAGLNRPSLQPEPGLDRALSQRAVNGLRLDA